MGISVPHLGDPEPNTDQPATHYKRFVRYSQVIYHHY